LEKISFTKAADERLGWVDGCTFLIRVSDSASAI
jgi:hypothetical protein